MDTHVSTTQTKKEDLTSQAQLNAMHTHSQSQSLPLLPTGNHCPNDAHHLIIPIALTTNV